MTRQTSFAQKLQSGWTQAQLMTHYCLTEDQYARILACLDEIKKRLDGRSEDVSKEQNVPLIDTAQKVAEQFKNFVLFYYPDLRPV